MIELFISSFVTLFVVLDPPGCAPIFASLTHGTTAAHRRTMALKSVAIAGSLLFVFAIFGEDFLAALGITLPAFKLAGGILLFLIAADMVFEKRTERRENRAETVLKNAAEKGVEAEDISVFPMAIPMIAGPGSIATIMLLVARTDGLEATLVVFAALALVLLLTLAALLAAGPLMRLLGAQIEAMLTRLLGVILAALAAQFVIDGIRQSFGIA